MRSRFAALGGSLFLGIVLIGQTLARDHDHDKDKDQADPHPMVIELFTSQGCSDCPPADKILNELAHRKDIIALSLPVTYWDMLGWKDTFATEANTQRQKAYAAAMGRSGIYTPQMIVDGVVTMVGNQRDDVMGTLAARDSGRSHEWNVPISVSLVSGHVEIDLPSAHGRRNKPIAAVWVMRTLSHATDQVDDGENRDRHLKYVNLVEDLQHAGEWSGDALKIDVPVNAGKAKADGVAVLLQLHDYGPVIGAATLALGDPAQTQASGQ
jgi:hypothetical protein